MAVDIPVRLSVEEYLAWEETNFEKHEYIDGEIRCMAGAKGRHNRIMSNTSTAIGRQLDDSDCYLLSSEMRVKVGGARFVYPDMSVVCGEAQFARDNEMELVNPALVIEVTSPASIDIDRGEKVDLYFEVPSIQAYLIIDQHRVRAELRLRSRGRWQPVSYETLDDVVPLDVLDCNLPLSQVYRGIAFDEPASD